ncbi:MAG: hypothetical protein QMB65_13725 [Vicingaceae bacterium]|jgi:hypothetical protein
MLLIQLVFALFFIAITTVLFYTSKESETKKAVKLIWFGVTFLALFFVVLNVCVSKVILEKNDFYGEYVVDRDFFSGKNADWQYSRYRFEIKENDSLYFYLIDEGKVLSTYVVAVQEVISYSSARLKVVKNTPSYHVLNSNPTIYREAWGFYMVLNSPFYGNMFFRKGGWDSIK